MLQSGRAYTADALASELEVSRRTVFRDLNMLEMANIPYYFDESRGGYSISQHFFLPPVNLTLGEALAILIVSSRARGGSHLPLLSECGKAALKLESALPPAVREHVGSIIHNVNFSLGPTASHEGKADYFDQLAHALAERRVCRIGYNSLFEQAQLEIEIEPLRLTFMGRAWYLIAYSRMHKEIRTFKLVRISSLAVMGQHFEHRPDVPENVFGNAWNMIPEGQEYDVHLRFDKKVAGNVAEVQWHPTQQSSFNEDGTMDFQARVDGLGEIAWWILGYGDQVEVLSPVPLREKVREIVASMSSIYAREPNR